MTVQQLERNSGRTTDRRVRTDAVEGTGAPRRTAGIPEVVPRWIPVERAPARRRPAPGHPRSVDVPVLRPVAVCPQPRAGGYRLGRWARLTITMTVLALGLLFVTGALGAEGRVATDAAVVVVGAGETLWSVAADAAGGPAVGTRVESIRALNDLDGWAADAVLPAGMSLLVPAFG